LLAESRKKPQAQLRRLRWRKNYATLIVGVKTPALRHGMLEISSHSASSEKMSDRAGGHAAV